VGVAGRRPVRGKASTSKTAHRGGMLRHKGGSIRKSSKRREKLIGEHSVRSERRVVEEILLWRGINSFTPMAHMLRCLLARSWKQRLSVCEQIGSLIVGSPCPRGGDGGRIGRRSTSTGPRGKIKNVLEKRVAQVRNSVGRGNRVGRQNFKGDRILTSS